MFYDKIVTDQDRMMEVAVVTSLFGGDRRRIGAAQSFFRSLGRQGIKLRLYVADASSISLCAAFTPWPPPYLAERIRIKTNAKNNGLWQKEALLNMAARKAVECCDYLVFVDCDISCDNSHWIANMCDLLQDDDDVVVQGFSFCFDTKDPDIKFQSVASNFDLNVESDLPLNPGMCWAMSSDFFQRLGGFNPYFVGGGGDSGFVSEVMPYIPNVERIESVIRPDTPRASVRCVSDEIHHHYHAPCAERRYDDRTKFYDSYVPSIRDHIHIDDNGLVAWKQI